MPLVEVSDEQEMAFLRGRRIAVVAKDSEAETWADVVIRLGSFCPPTDIMACGELPPPETIRPIPLRTWWLPASDPTPLRAWLEDKKQCMAWRWSIGWEDDARRATPGVTLTDVLRIVYMCRWAGPESVELRGLREHSELLQESYGFEPRGDHLFWGVPACL